MQCPRVSREALREQAVEIHPLNLVDLQLRPEEHVVDATVAEQTDSGVFGLLLGVAWLPAVTYLIAAVLIWNFPITRSRQKAILRAIARRRFAMLGNGHALYHLTFVDDVVEWNGHRLTAEGIPTDVAEAALSAGFDDVVDAADRAAASTSTAHLQPATMNCCPWGASPSCRRPRSPTRPPSMSSSSRT